MARARSVIEARRLYKERRHDEALALITSSLPRLARPADARDEELARELLITLGQIRDDYGEYGASAQAFGLASRCPPDGEHSHPLAAVACERRYRSLEQDCADRAQKRLNIRKEIDSKVETLNDARRRHELLPWLWAQARLLSGAHVDDRPSADALDRAEEAVTRAHECEVSTGRPPSRRLAITRLRIARLRATHLDSDSPFCKRQQAIAHAREQLLHARTITDGGAGDESDPLESLPTAITYEEARLELVAREWQKASSCLDEVIADSGPAHQASLVWQIYCRRMNGEPAEELLHSIHALLHERASDNTPSPVVNEDLRAALYTERAALIEAHDPAGALQEYKRALTRRPRMSTALRGKVRCLQMCGETDEAVAVAQRLLEPGIQPEEGPTAEVLSEIGQLYLTKGDRELARALFERAIEQLPVYGFAYGRKTAVLREKGEVKAAIRFAEETLASEADLLNGLGSVRLELGDSYLTARRVNSAIEQFIAAEEDVYPVVRERGRAGRIRAHLWKRDLDGARTAVHTRTVEPPSARLEDVAGWFHGTVGAYSVALEHFERSATMHPYDPSPLIGKARVLRLLGRPAAVRRLLADKAEEWPTGNAARLHNEIGWAAVDERNYSDALRRFERVLSLNPDWQAALRGRIVALARGDYPHGLLHKRIDEAQDKMVDKDPQARASVLTEAGIALLDCGDIRAARTMFLEANALSDSVSQRVLQGHALLKAHSLSEAWSCARDAGRQAAELTASRLDIAAIRDELEELTGELVREPHQIEQLFSPFHGLCSALTHTSYGVRASECMLGLWNVTQAKAEVSSVTARGLQKALLDQLDELREREGAISAELTTDPDVLLLEGACHLASATPEAAARAFERAASAYGSGSLPPQVGKALVLLEQQQYHAARDCLEPLARGPHASVRTRELLAWSMLHLKQRGESVRRTMVLRVEGRMPQRLTHLLRTPDTDGGQIASLCLDIIKEEPSRVDAYLCLGALAIHEGRTAEGLSYLRQAIDAAPSLAHPLRENAAALLRIEDYERASASLAQAIAIDPNDARSRLLEGLIALQQDQPIAAMAPLRRAQELDPYDPHAALVLATALQRSGKDDEAIAELTRALNRVPPHRSVMLLLARARAQHALARTRADSAPEATLSAALADAVLATKRTSTARERAEAEYHRGVILIARHSKRAATRALDAAILHDPSLLGARQALAALRESGDDDANARLLRRAAYLTMILATAITALFVIEGFLTAKAQGAHFHWTPVGYLVLVPIVVIALTGLLPRVARIRVRELEITIAAPPSTPETTWTTPDFGRTPLSTMWGPSTYRASDIVSDLAGLPEWG